MGLHLFQIDAFTDRPFAGNPAAVCLLSGPRSDGWMQAVAREMNLSETAFLSARGDAAEGFDLRWFTPRVEVDLCGHATLASAHHLFERGHLAPTGTARFHTRSGLLTARRGDGGWIEMDFPSRPPRPLEPPELLRAALGEEPRWTGTDGDDLLVLVADEGAVRHLRPDLAALERLPARGVIVTAAAEPGRGYDFVSRFFAPAVGVDEDPVTGSAHCCLGPFWSERLGRADLVARQVSARGGTLRVRPRGDRVLLSGQAVTVLAMELLDGAGREPSAAG